MGVYLGPSHDDRREAEGEVASEDCKIAALGSGRPDDAVVDEDWMQDFEGHVTTIEAVVRRLVREEARDSSILYGMEIEKAVTAIVMTCRDRLSVGRPHLAQTVKGLTAVARLHYVRYHSDPNKPPTLLWSAVRLFHMIRMAPCGQSDVPGDVALLLDVLAAHDPVATPGLDSPAVAIDTAARLAEYAGVEADAEALGSAEALARWAVEELPATDPNRVVGLHTLLGILIRRWETTDADLSGELIPLADGISDGMHQHDPRWPHLVAGAGGAYYVAATRTQSVTLLDRSIDLFGQALNAMADDLPSKAGYLQNLGRAHLVRGTWECASETPMEAISHLRAAVSCSAQADPHLAERHAWLAMALLSGSRPNTAQAARQLDIACACRETPGHDRCPGLLAQVTLLLWRVGPKDDAVLDRAVRLLTETEAGPQAHTAFKHGDALVEILWERWERNREIADVDEVIHRLAARTQADDAPPLLLNLLARSLRARWERTGDSLAIRQAISYLGKAVECSHPDDSGIAMYRHNLGAMCLRLHQASGDDDALDHAVRHIEGALNMCRNGDSYLPMFANSAAAARLLLWQRNGDDADLRHSVSLSRRSVTATPMEHPDRAAHLTTFVAAAMHAAVRFGDTAPLNEAVQTLESGIDGVDLAHPAYGAVILDFGQALLLQGQVRNDLNLVARGRDLMRESVHHPHVRTLDAILAFRRWANEAAATQDWDAAAQALSNAVTRLANQPGYRLSRPDHEWLLINLASLATDAAAASLNNDDNDHALECLEAGRGVLLAKGLHMDGVLLRLEHQDEDLAQRVREVRALLSGSERGALSSWAVDTRQSATRGVSIS